MSREVFEENYRVYWATTVGNIAAPTVAEVAAATYIGSYVTKDGVALNISENGVGIASIDTTFDAEVGGSWGVAPELTLFRDGVTETAGWNLIIKGTNGFLIVATFGVVTAGAKCYVLPAEMGIGKPTNSAANEPQKFTVRFFVTSTPNLKAVIAA